MSYNAWLVQLNQFRESTKANTYIEGVVKVKPADASRGTVEIEVIDDKPHRISVNKEQATFIIISLMKLFNIETNK